MSNYILKGKKPVLIKDVLEWARWFETAKRHVAKDDVGKIRVSTVFLGIDHNFAGGTPILFETMIFGSKKHEGYQERYCTWQEAEEGHKRALKLVKQKKAVK